MGGFCGIIWYFVLIQNLYGEPCAMVHFLLTSFRFSIHVGSRQYVGAVVIEKEEKNR